MPPEVRAGVTPKLHADKNIGEWNTFEITLRGEVDIIKSDNLLRRFTEEFLKKRLDGEAPSLMGFPPLGYLAAYANSHLRFPVREAAFLEDEAAFLENDVAFPVRETAFPGGEIPSLVELPPMG